MEQSKELIKTAQQYYQIVGQSATECDTIPGRQCKFTYLFSEKLFGKNCNFD